MDTTNLKTPRAGVSSAVPWYRRLLFGSPIPTEHEEHSRLPKVLALPVFSSDAISSSVYATQEILLVLGAAGLWLQQQRGLYNALTLGITVGIVVLLLIVVASYRQTIFAYPNGGGSYVVSRENLGVSAGLVAGAALLVDYVLTVAVSIASGVQNILSTPVFSGIANEQVAVCVLCIAVVAFLNLRGMRESGTLFAIPTYTFVALAFLMIVLGLVGEHLGWHMDRTAVNHQLPDGAYTVRTIGSLAVLALVLRAFASGCAAMTGTEAISNTVPSFRPPESRNAAATLVMMAVILSGLFLGISKLASDLGVVYGHSHVYTSSAVIEQLSGAVFGRTGPTWRVVLYYAMQVATMMILVVAANTSFAGFPRLAAILARDRFMPRQMTNLGDKLVFTNGILLLALAAMALIVAFGGSVDRLIPLYAIGVFTAFTLSQCGMVIHWRKEHDRRHLGRMLINGFGALCTFIVLCVITIEKAHEGAWLVLVIAALLIAMFRGISTHYAYLRSHLTIVGYERHRAHLTNTVLVLVPSLHRGVFPALDYARSLSPDCRGIHIEINPEETPRLRREWEQYVGEDLPLVILPSPYRSLVTPLLMYLEEAQRERKNHIVTVVVPEFVPGRWWHAILHNANGFLVKYHLSHKPGVVVTNVRYFLANGGTPELGGGDGSPSPSTSPPTGISAR